MKTKLITTLATVALAGSLSAANVTFSNFASDFSALEAVTLASSGAVVADGTGTVSIGYFADESAIASAGSLAALDSAFTQFGASTSFGGAGAFNIGGLFIGGADQAILAGSSFIGENIYMYGKNTPTNEAFVYKFTNTFEQDNPLFADTVVMLDGASLLLGSAISSPTVDVGLGADSHVQMVSVPEPSTAGLIAGLLALGSVMLRRRAA